MGQQIEIEFRSRFGEKKHQELKDLLNQNAEDLGEDDKNVFFFIFPDKLLKASNEISKKRAKVVLKLNKISHGCNFEEIEVFFKPSDVDKIVELFKTLNLNADLMESFQKRHNYRYHGVDAALKAFNSSSVIRWTSNS